MCEAVEIEGSGFSDLMVGEMFSWEKVFTLEETQLFCNVSGDNNRIHYNDEFAQEHGFAGSVVHGVRSLSEVSRACGDRFFVAGVVCLNLDAEFKRPVYHGKLYVFKLRVLELSAGRKNNVFLSFDVTNQEGKICVCGKVRLLFP